MELAEISQDGSTLTVRVPLTFRKRSGHKLVIAPNGSDSWAPPRPRVDNAMVKAIGRAIRWRKLLETGTHTTVAEGVVTLLKEEHENSASRIFSNDRDCLVPHVHSRRAKGSVCLCRNEMTLDVESVVGRCVS